MRSASASNSCSIAEQESPSSSGEISSSCTATDDSASPGQSVPSESPEVAQIKVGTVCSMCCKLPCKGAVSRVDTIFTLCV